MTLIFLLFWSPFSAAGAELHDIVVAGDVAELEAFFAANPDADVNATDFLLGTALHHATLSDNVAATKVLIAQGANIEAVAELQGARALHLAADVGSRRVAQLLLEAGASVEARDGNQRTALARAAIANQTALLAMLIEHGAAVDGRDELFERTALIEAAYVGAVDSATYLLSAGADIDARDNRGKSAIWYASTPESYSPAGGPALLQLLARHGADLEAADNTGMTPLAWARAGTGRAETYREIAEVLVELGAQK